jgi:hypothetical protein
MIAPEAVRQSQPPNKLTHKVGMTNNCPSSPYRPASVTINENFHRP